MFWYLNTAALACSLLALASYRRSDEISSVALVAAWLLLGAAVGVMYG